MNKIKKRSVNLPVELLRLIPAKEIKKIPARLPVELLREIFETYLRFDLPVQVLLEVCRQWRAVALETQTLWRRLLLSADAILPSLRAGSVHACATEGQTEHILKRSGSITKLEVTFVLGPKEGDTPTPDTRATLFKTVGHTALHRISFLCIIVNPETTLPLVTASLHGVFKGALPALESLMIASAQAIGNLYEPLSTLMEIIQDTSMRLKSLYLENVSKDFIVRAAEQTFWSRLIRITIRNEFDPLDVKLLSLPPDLEFFSFSGELVATLPPATAHLNSALKTRVQLSELKWLRVGLISMGTLARLNLPQLHTMAIDSVQDNYPFPAPLPGTLLLPALTVLQIATVHPTIACIHAPRLDTLCLTIPALNQADADRVLGTVFYGGVEMMRPKHLKLRGPVHDKHLITALRAMGDRLVTLELDNQMPFGKTSWQEITPSVATRRRPKAAAGSRATTFTTKSRSPASAIHRPTPRGTAAATVATAGVGGRFNTPLAQALRSLVLDVYKNPMAQSKVKRGNEEYQSLLKLACKWREAPGIEEKVDSPMCVSCPDEEQSKHSDPTDEPQGDTEYVQIRNLTAQIRIERTVFNGNYSTVYKGSWDTTPPKVSALVAIKVFQTGLNNTNEDVNPDGKYPAYNRRFHRELAIACRADHPNVVPLFGYAEVPNAAGDICLAVVSEWAPNGNATAYTDENFGSEKALNLLHDASKGLRYLHASDPPIVHGDVKPPNVVIGSDGTAKLCDFGLSRFVLGGGLRTGLTTPVYSGTPRYLAYELVVPPPGEKAIPTTATDMWSLGCLALEVIYKTRPYDKVPIDPSDPSEWMVRSAISEMRSPASRPEELRERGLPARAFNDLEDTLRRFWKKLEECWDVGPAGRPSIYDMCEYLDREVKGLSGALCVALGR